MQEKLNRRFERMCRSAELNYEKIQGLEFKYKIGGKKTFLKFCLEVKLEKDFVPLKKTPYRDGMEKL